MPYSYTLEGDVEDVSRQHIANRASLVVHPAPWYIGVKRVPLFNEQRDGLKTELIAVGLDGQPVPGVAIDVTLTQVQWQSVRRAEGDGFYGWETQRIEVPAGAWRVTSAAAPVPLNVDLPAGGYFVLEARARRRIRGAMPSRASRSTRWAAATRPGSATTTTGSTLSPTAPPTSRAIPRGS